MHPSKTFELRISFSGQGQPALNIKDQVKAWLQQGGVTSFVEGVVDSLDVDHEFGLNADRDLFAELGGDTSPISVFKYSQEALLDLQQKLDRHFTVGITSAMHEMDTATWLDGWKDSFKPFPTERFWVYPPWCKEPVPAGKIPLVIEPAAAFGTGQHATTRLCLSQLELITAELEKSAPAHSLRSARLLDVGTGTGILAIAAAKLGFGQITGTDIDEDAISAAHTNATANNVALDIALGSIPPSPAGYDVILANILAVVLGPMLPELARMARPAGGYIVLSGILAEEADIMIQHAIGAGLTFVRRETLDDWAGLVLRRER